MGMVDEKPDVNLRLMGIRGCGFEYRSEARPVEHEHMVLVIGEKTGDEPPHYPCLDPHSTTPSRSILLSKLEPKMGRRLFPMSGLHILRKLVPELRMDLGIPRVPRQWFDIYADGRADTLD
ncbi:aconitate hydratase [Hypoxylon texense]